MVPDADSNQPAEPCTDAVQRAQRLESLGRLAADAAHDFNNVLGVILGYVELARMGLGEEHAKVRRHLGLALSTVARARDLSDALLEFSPRAPRQPEVADLGEAVRTACDLLARTSDPRVEIEQTLAEGALCTPLDRAGLGQVVTNLCINAVEAMPEGGRLQVSTERVEVGEGAVLPAGDYAVLEVRDSGGGIPPDVRESVFEARFTSRPETHSGLGLWVARELVQRYGGRIEAGGTGQGGAFRVWLPTSLRATSRGERPTPTPKGADVLVVDGDPDVRRVLCAYLEAEGCTVYEAGSAAEAERLLREPAAAVGLVFVAARLPDAAGEDLAWLAAGLPQPVPTVFLSAGGGTPRLPAATPVLKAPFLHADLIRVLRADLGIGTG